MLGHLKTFLVFLFTVIFSGLLVAATYFHEEITTAFPALDPSYIPIVATGIITVILFVLWRTQIENERSREEFVSIITHKFRTPLTGVKWAIEMLRNNITEQQKQDILAHMENSNQRLMEIVDLMVGFAQFDRHLEYAYEATSLRETVNVSLQKYGDQIRTKNVSFKINADPEMPLVVTDKRKIQFVVDMLIDNAIKYTPAGGVITITFSRDKKSLVLAVHDTGIGVSYADGRHLFKKFYRSSNAKNADTEGMGLGLYAAKAIVDKHHGRIWFDSGGAGKGSTFYLALKAQA
ncbi:TPA: hypothetical protein DCQ44_01785 [Candidatus Taylorbacteria bacterium]|nr:hypothetical protein [Candidatus Taylorbacteria bacterium]